MKKFDLSIYKYSKPYFDLFDVYFKENSIKKEFFLLDNDITPSTYRQCRKEESNSGPKIVKSLSKKFSFKTFFRDAPGKGALLKNAILKLLSTRNGVF